MKPEDRIIVALDVDSPDSAISLVKDLAPHVGLFKLGLQFINAMLASIIVPKEEPEAVNNLQRIRELFELLDGNVLWDGKFKDIPNTIIGASEEVGKIGVEMFNVHASGGIEMMRAAVGNKAAGQKVLAVTVLTSLAEDDAHLIYGAPSKAKVIEFARWAKIAGVDGLICSPQELGVLGERKELDGLLRVTPGIRPKWAVKGDQSRIMTPADAVKAGVDYLVIGRPIRQPPKEISGPVEAAKKIAEEIAEALSETE